MDRQAVGFVGLGTMGSPMAGHLATTGTPTWVWNRTPGKGAHAVSCGARVAADLHELASACPIVCLCLGRTEDVAEVVQVLLGSMPAGGLLIDHSTIAPSGARKIHEQCAEKRIGFVDAPITGGSMGAQYGTLTIFCGGAESDFARAEPILRAYGKRIAYVGGPGQGQMMKMANQIAVGGALLGLCESLAFAKRAGLDLATTRDLLSTGAAGSWAFENYGPKVISGDHSPGFSIKNQRKDFGYCLESAADAGMGLPATELADRLLAALTAAGREEEATTALFDVLCQGVPT